MKRDYRYLLSLTAYIIPTVTILYFTLDLVFNKDHEREGLVKFLVYYLYFRLFQFLIEYS
jgi:hypothetical protein